MTKRWDSVSSLRAWDGRPCCIIQPQLTLSLWGATSSDSLWGEESVQVSVSMLDLVTDLCAEKYLITKKSNVQPGSSFRITFGMLDLS